MSRIVGGLLLALAFASCTKVGPDYAPPETPMPDVAPMPDRWFTEATSGLARETRASKRGGRFSRILS